MTREQSWQVQGVTLTLLRHITSLRYTVSVFRIPCGLYGSPGHVEMMALDLSTTRRRGTRPRCWRRRRETWTTAARACWRSRLASGWRTVDLTGLTCDCEGQVGANRQSLAATRVVALQSLYSSLTEYVNLPS